MGWTWHYLHHKIPWAHVQRIMADLPGYEPAKPKEEKAKSTGHSIHLPDALESEDDLMNYFSDHS